MTKRAALISLCLIYLSGNPAAGDWPTFGRDSNRSNVTDRRLKLPLKQAWTFKPVRGPEPSWPAPAGQDYFHRHHNLRPTVTYDRAFHVVGSGDTIYFGSSADDKVYAIDAGTGQLQWQFFTEGPIRFAPVIAGDRLYVGSDDGRVYCLDGDDGSLLWKYDAAENKRLIPGNGRIISAQAVRTGLIVDDGIVYFGAGLFPMQGAYLVALKASDGSEIWKEELKVSPQGYMLASDDRLYVPTGRTNPAIFARSSGRYMGQLSSGGGAYALLTEDALVTGPGRGAKGLDVGDLETKDRFATFGGLRMIVKDSVAYMQSETQLSAFDRKKHFELSREHSLLSKQVAAIEKKIKSISPDGKAVLQKELQELKAQMRQIDEQRSKCYLWTKPCEHSASMILAGNTLFVGGDNAVAAMNTETGDVVWKAGVEGRAIGLSAVNNSLIVSTDQGSIHSFMRDAPSNFRRIKPSVKEDPYPKDRLSVLYREAARHIVQQLDCTKGYCLVLDSGKGRLAYELAKLTDFQIVCVEENPDDVAVARDAIDKSGLCGRVTVHQRRVSALPYTSFFANLIVCDEALVGGYLPADSREVLRLLRPCGGVLAIGHPTGRWQKGDLIKWGYSVPGWKVSESDGISWGLARRPALEGAGEWTHMYAEPGNSACSGDKIVDGDTAIQWFGEPGPARIIDRHHRNVSPLSKDGRLFVPGDCIVYAVDAYNGAILWEAEIPDSRRLGPFLDSGSMALDERHLYTVARDTCHALDVKTGKVVRSYTMPQLTPGKPHKWGHISLAGESFVGSACRPGASYTETSYDADMALWYHDMKLVTSDYVFSVDKGTGKSRWNYDDGLILNPTIAADDKRMYFVVTDSPDALAEESGRMPVKILFGGGKQHIVALDLETGDEVYKKELDTSDFKEPVYLNYADGVLLFSGSRLIGNSVRYYYRAFEAGSGDPLWQAFHDTGLAKDGGHGEYNRHPTIIDDVVYAWPYAYRLKTGERVEDWKMDRRGHGCGGVSASAQCLFWRGGNPWTYDLGPDGGPARLNIVTRPGCWINMIPAGGLVLIPEASSGCTCGFPMQTSLAYIPKRLLD